MLDVSYQSVANWVQLQTEQLPPAALPSTTDVVELDELFTFVAQKKTKCM